MSENQERSRGVTRRQVLVAGAGAAGALALGGYGLGRVLARGSSSAAELAPDLVIRAVPTTVDLGSRRARTWTYGGALPGPGVRLRQGEPVRIRVENGLPEETSVHWHGIRLANAADGVPGLTQAPIAPGDSFTYAFTPPDAGTYFLHSHSGLQLDRGLYASLVVEPKREPMDYDREDVLLLDDWLDGLDGTPDDRLSSLKRSGMPMEGMDMGAGVDMGSTAGMGMGMGMDDGGAARGPHTALDGGAPTAGSLAALANAMENGAVDPGDVPDYPAYLINGRPPDDPHRLAVRGRERVRLRLINAAADTTFCFFVEGHAMTVVHADGAAVRPVDTDALLIGMGERYDVLVEARSVGASRMIAVPLGKQGRAVAVLRAGPTRGRATSPSAPFRMPRRIASYADLQSTGAPPRTAIAAHETRLALDMEMGKYVWTIGGQAFDGCSRDPRCARGAPALHHGQPDDDAPSHAPARSLVPSGGRRAAQGHHPGAPDARGRGRLAPGQPGQLGLPLSQRLPPGGGDDAPSGGGLSAVPQLAAAPVPHAPGSDLR